MSGLLSRLFGTGTGGAGGAGAPARPAPRTDKTTTSTSPPPLTLTTFAVQALGWTLAYVLARTLWKALVERDYKADEVGVCGVTFLSHCPVASLSRCELWSARGMGGCRESDYGDAVALPRLPVRPGHGTAHSARLTAVHWPLPQPRAMPCAVLCMSSLLWMVLLCARCTVLCHGTTVIVGRGVHA